MPLKLLADETGAFPFKMDSAKVEDIKSCIEKTVELYGKIDGLANCVGSVLLKPAHIIKDEEWNEVITTNLTTSFFILRSAVKKMMKTGGSIVLVSSVAAKLGLPNHEAIAAAKAGIIGLTISAAASYAPGKIRVNCVAPGLTRTEMTSSITNNENALMASQEMIPLKRIGEPADIARAIEWLLLPDQSWITGQVISVDGGLSSVRSAR